MEQFAIETLATDFLIVLLGGLVAGVLCKRTGVSLLVGYLVIGGLLGQGCLGVVAQDDRWLEVMANAGALLLLFAVGLEFSIEQLVRLRRYIFLGGSVQMLLVAVPVTAISWLFGFQWQASILIGASVSLSSTILVFKALNEWGQASTPPGRRAIAMLLFQDVALVPIILLVPALSGQADSHLGLQLARLALIAFGFVIAVYWLRRCVARYIVPNLINLRSTELVVLFAVIVLSGSCWIANRLSMPAAVGALAAGFILSGNRLTHQVDTLVLPFRETFAAVFFVSLGSLVRPDLLIQEPWLIIGILVSLLTVKTLAAMTALKLTGLKWRQSLATGLGLSQLGEFSFLLIGAGASQEILDQSVYQRILLVAIGTLILTPQFIKFGLKWGDLTGDDEVGHGVQHYAVSDSPRAVVVGIGVIGGRTAARLETLGVQVRLVDHSPLNLYPFAQQGFQTVSGDALEESVLSKMGLEESQIAIVSVPDDTTAIQIVAALRQRNSNLFILVRCRYFSNILELEKVGANQVVSEEKETSSVITQICEKMLWKSQGGAK